MISAGHGGKSPAASHNAHQVGHNSRAAPIGLCMRASLAYSPRRARTWAQFTRASQPCVVFGGDFLAFFRAGGAAGSFVVPLRDAAAGLRAPDADASAPFCGRGFVGHCASVRQALHCSHCARASAYARAIRATGIS